MRQFLADLFKNVTNSHWELGRVSAAWAIVSTTGLAIYQLVMGQAISLSEYAQSMMTVFGGCTFFIAGKDIARAHATKNEAAPELPPSA